MRTLLILALLALAAHDYAAGQQPAGRTFFKSGDKLYMRETLTVLSREVEIHIPASESGDGAADGLPNWTVSVAKEEGEGRYARAVLAFYSRYTGDSRYIIIEKFREPYRSGIYITGAAIFWANAIYEVNAGTAQQPDMKQLPASRLQQVKYRDTPLERVVVFDDYFAWETEKHQSYYMPRDYVKNVDDIERCLVMMESGRRFRISDFEEGE